MIQPPRPRRRPFVVGLLAIASAGLAMVLLATVPAAAFGVVRISVSGRAALPWEPRFVLFAFTMTLLGALAGVTGFGLWRQRRWSRALALFLWPALLGVRYADRSETHGIALPLGVILIVVGSLWWYLYRRPVVVAYFDQLGT